MMMAAMAFNEEVAANRANWNARAKVHAHSAYYDLERYVKDPTAISREVEWDRHALGNVAGLDLLHLQCHIGADSISWARLGANVTGLDFSEEALQVARDLSKRTDAQVTFVQSDVREADRVLARQFDVVYTSVGVLCWLPDIIDRVEEYDWLAWQAFPWMIQGPEGQWRFPPGRPRLPLQFSISAPRRS